MEHSVNVSPDAATDEPASRALIEASLDDGRDKRPGRATRADGWTPEAIRRFLTTLADCGVVADAARAAGMSGRSAYILRRRAEGRAFGLAWRAAQRLARQRLSDDLMSRAVYGHVEICKRGDEVVERHRYDNRLSMAVLTRLDQQVGANDEENRIARLVANEFDQFLNIVCAGGESADRFLEDRIEAESRYVPSKEAELLRRTGNYRRYGVGLPGEIDISDLDLANRRNWTREQVERAGRAGLPDALDDDESE